MISFARAAALAAASLDPSESEGLKFNLICIESIIGSGKDVHAKVLRSKPRIIIHVSNVALVCIPG